MKLFCQNEDWIEGGPRINIKIILNKRWFIGNLSFYTFEQTLFWGSSLLQGSRKKVCNEFPSCFLFISACFCWKDIFYLVIINGLLHLSVKKKKHLIYFIKYFNIFYKKKKKKKIQSNWEPLPFLKSVKNLLYVVCQVLVNFLGTSHNYYYNYRELLVCNGKKNHFFSN